MSSKTEKFDTDDGEELKEVGKECLNAVHKIGKAFEKSGRKTEVLDYFQRTTAYADGMVKLGIVKATFSPTEISYLMKAILRMKKESVSNKRRP